jgi:hypothetical protein
MGYEPLKSQSKIWMSSCVHPSKIFVWEGKVEFDMQVTIESGIACTHSLKRRNLTADP